MTPVTVYDLAARTATPTKVNQDNLRGARGCVIYINCSTSSATPSVVVTLQGFDPLSGEYWTILASAAITGAGNTVMRIYPGLTAIANLTASDVLPPRWAVDATHADADSITYSVTVHPIP
jgi:hypothetical protein